MLVLYHMTAYNLVLMGVAGLWDVSMFRMSLCPSRFSVNLRFFARPRQRAL